MIHYILRRVGQSTITVLLVTLIIFVSEAVRDAFDPRKSVA